MMITLLYFFVFALIYVLLAPISSKSIERKFSIREEVKSSSFDCDTSSLKYHKHVARLRASRLFIAWFRSFFADHKDLNFACFIFLAFGFSSCNETSSSVPNEPAFHYPYESWADIDGDYIASSSCGHTSMADHALTYLTERYEDGVDQLTQRISSEELNSFSRKSHEAIKSVYPVVKNKDSKRVQKVFRDLKQFTPKSIRSSLEVYLVASKQVANAFTVAGGKIYMTTALYSTLRNDEELALVLGHEISHQVKGHTTIKLRQSKFLVDNLGQTGGALTNWIINLVTLPFNAPEEYEADCGGMWLCAQAGYNTELGILIFNRWAKQERNAPRNSFISTHPKSFKRFACCATLTAEAKERARNNQSINNQ